MTFPSAPAGLTAGAVAGEGESNRADRRLPAVASLENSTSSGDAAERIRAVDHLLANERLLDRVPSA